MIFVKYGTKNNLESLASGKMRFMPLRYYREYERKEEIKSGIADPFEGMMIERVNNLTIEYSDGKIEDYSGNIELNLDFGTVAFTPVFCISGYNDLNEMSNNLEIIKEKFPNYTHCLIIEQVDTFICEVHKWSAGLVSRFVEYEEIPFKEKFIDNYECAFFKRPIFSYQNEYRFVSSNTRISEPLFLQFDSNVSMEIIAIR